MSAAPAAVEIVVAPPDATLGESAGDPTHAHTLGLLEAFGHAELLLVGLPGALAADFLRHAAGLVRAGRRFADGEEATGLFPNAPAVLRRVGARHFAEYLPALVARHGSDDVAVLQIVYPDKAGKFPWDPGSDLRLRLVEPVLDGKFRKCRFSEAAKPSPR